jgi:sensor c-di-GMP phosphodiesterase-like protein
MTLGVTNEQGEVFALSGKLDPAMVRDIVHHGKAGSDGQYIFSSTGAHGIVAFAITDHANARAHLDVRIGDILPMSLAMSALLVWVVIWVSRQRLAPEKELEIATRKREFVAHYQPIIELATGRCVAAEALIRWRRPDGSWMLPDLFIPMAEKTGLMPQLTVQMIDRVIDDMDYLLRTDRNLHISINIPAIEMESGRFLPLLTAATRKARIHPSQIWLEITERGFMNADAATKAVEQARSAGFIVAIDDFGTGYSSLSLLERLPLDALKIDKSFVDAIGRDAATSVVTPHIIAMAQGLKLKMIAEGIETREQETYLQDAGVELAQGWFYSKALPPDEFAAFYRRANFSDLDNPNVHRTFAESMTSCA